MNRCKISSSPILVGVALLACSFQGMEAAEPQPLFQSAKQAQAQENVVDMAMYLYAYISHDPEAMRFDAEHAQQVREVWKKSRQRAIDALISERNLRSALKACQGTNSGGLGTGSYGVTVLSELQDPKPPATPRSYPLVCRGGGAMHFGYTPFSNVSRNPQVWITFQRASQGVGANWQNLSTLQPGQCSWLDRPIGDAEPNRIVLREVQNFSIQWQRGQVTGIVSGLEHVSGLSFRSNRYQEFHVYNDGLGSFITTAIGQRR